MSASTSSCTRPFELTSCPPGRAAPPSGALTRPPGSGDIAALRPKRRLSLRLGERESVEFGLHCREQLLAGPLGAEVDANAE